MRALHIATLVVVLGVASSISGCKGQRSASKICSVLHAKGIADGCAPVTPSGITAAAKDIAEFDLLDEKGGKFGKKGLVLAFDSKEKTDETYAKMKAANPSGYVKGRSEKDFFLIVCDTNDGSIGRRVTSFLSSDD